MYNRKNLHDMAAGCDKVSWQDSNSFKACCVVHDDKTPSMSVTETPDGKILAFCHAGCLQTAVTDALGITSGKPHLYTPRLPRQIQIQTQTRAPTFSKAERIWQGTMPDELISWDQAVLEHPYPMKKGIEHACGAARFLVTGSQIGKEADCIILPMRTLEGEFTGIEAINSEGVKQTFGSKGVLVLGNDRDSSLPQLVVEGWATGVAVLDICQWNACVYVAFGKGRLGAVALRVQTKYCDRTIVIVEEHDG